MEREGRKKELKLLVVNQKKRRRVSPLYSTVLNCVERVRKMIIYFNIGEHLMLKRNDIETLEKPYWHYWKKEVLEDLETF